MDIDVVMDILVNATREYQKMDSTASREDLVKHLTQVHTKLPCKMRETLSVERFVVFWID